MIWILTFIIAVFSIIIEIFSTILMLTGLSREKSRFQVISMLTSTGYTTRESELIMLDPRRRKYAQRLIVFGYCATVSIVSILVSSLTTNKNWHDYVIATSFIVVFIAIINNKKLRQSIDPKIQNFGARLIYGKTENYLIIIESMHEKVVGKIKLNTLPSPFENITMQDIKKNNAFNLLAIERNNQVLKSLSDDDQIKKGDLIIVYGEKEKIEKLFDIIKSVNK